jgi:Major Facilitator Superfamily
MIFIANAVGYWGFLVFLQKYMLTEFGLSFRRSLLLTMAFYAAMLIWPFAGAAVSDRIGRRPAGIIGGVALAIGSVVGFSSHSLVTFAVAQLFGIGLLGWTWSVGQTYVAELLPDPGAGHRFRARRRHRPAARHRRPDRHRAAGRAGRPAHGGPVVRSWDAEPSRPSRGGLRPAAATGRAAASRRR